MDARLSPAVAKMGNRYAVLLSGAAGLNVATPFNSPFSPNLPAHGRHSFEWWMPSNFHPLKTNYLPVKKQKTRPPKVRCRRFCGIKAPMYSRANLWKCFWPDLLVFLEDILVVLLSKRAAVVASLQSANNSPNNLKSHAGPSVESIVI